MGSLFLRSNAIKLALFTAMTLICAACASNKEVLHNNVKQQSIPMLEENIGRGMDINEKDGYGFTPLILAAYDGYSPVVKYLCEKGANVNAQNKEGMSALLYAVFYGYDAIFDTLMDYGADISLVNKQGHNAIWYAKQYKRHEMYRKLEKAGTKGLQAD